MSYTLELIESFFRAVTGTWEFIRSRPKSGGHVAASHAPENPNLLSTFTSAAKLHPNTLSAKADWRTRTCTVVGHNGMMLWFTFEQIEADCRQCLSTLENWHGFNPPQPTSAATTTATTPSTAPSSAPELPATRGGRRLWRSRDAQN